MSIAPQVAKCKSTLKYRVPPQKTGHYLILCNVKAIKAIMHSEMTNFDFDYAQVALT
jgi:hypothetical protein